MNDKIEEYNRIMPTELKMLLNNSPKDDLEWALIMYLFENTKKGNIITLKKLSNLFNVDNDILFKKLNGMGKLWVVQQLEGSGSDTYYTYEITEIGANFLVKLIELLEIK